MTTAGRTTHSESPHDSDVVLALSGVDLVRGGRTILRRIDWRVRRGERWAVLGPNGSGKTTLLRVASLYLHPSRGAVDVLGQRLGRTDTRELRRHAQLTSAALADMLQPKLRAEDVVVTGKYAALAPWWHQYTAADRRKARALLDRFGCRALAGAAFGTLSSGERQRVLLARTLMSDPALWLLDEPTAGLDLGGREQLVALLGTVAADAGSAVHRDGDPSRRGDSPRVHPRAAAGRRTGPRGRRHRGRADFRPPVELLRRQR